MKRFCAVALLCVLACFVCPSDRKTPDVAVNDVEENSPLRPESMRFDWYLLPRRRVGQADECRHKGFQILQLVLNRKTGVPTTFYCTPCFCMRADEWPNM